MDRKILLAMPNGATITRSTIDLFLKIVHLHPDAEIVIGTPPPAPSIIEFHGMDLARIAEISSKEIASMAIETKSKKNHHEPFYKAIYNKNSRKRNY